MDIAFGLTVKEMGKGDWRMEKIEINAAFVLLFENIQTVLNRTVDILGNENFSEAEKNHLIQTMLALSDQLDIVKESVIKFEIRAPKKIVDDNTISYGKN